MSLSNSISLFLSALIKKGLFGKSVEFAWVNSALDFKTFPSLWENPHLVTLSLSKSSGKDPSMILARQKTGEMQFVSIFSRLAFLFLLSLTVPAFSQSGGSSAAFSRVPVGLQASAYGNAMTSFIWQGNQAFHNPALAARKTSKEAEISSKILAFDRQSNFVNFSAPMPPTAGISISLLHGGVQDIDLRTLSGYPDGTASTNEFLLHTAFGIAFSEKLSAGIGIRLYRSQLVREVDAATAVGLDLGMLYTPNATTALAFTVQDIMGDFTWNTNDFYGTENSINRIDQTPLRITVSASKMIDEKFIFSLESEMRQLSGEGLSVAEFAFPSALNRTDVTQSVFIHRGGFQYSFSETIQFMGGLQAVGLGSDVPEWSPSLGFQINVGDHRFSPRIGYAVHRESLGISYAHTLALTFSL